MKPKITFSILLFIVNYVCQAAKIVLIPMFGQSHYLVMQKLAETLVSRGHEVTIFVGKEGSYATGQANTKIFQVSQEFIDENVYARKVVFNSDYIGKVPSFIAFKMLTVVQKPYCNFFLSDKTVLDELQTADVVVGDSLYPCSSLAADMFDKHHVVVHLTSGGVPQLNLLGITSYPSYVPQYGSYVPSRMSLLDRLWNVKAYLLNVFVIEVWIYPAYNEIKIKHKIKAAKSIRETMTTVDLVLMEKDFAVQYAQPVPPYVKEVGSFKASPAKALPADLEDFMQSSGDNGVIFISFGSMVDSFKNDVIKVMSDAFSQLPQKVLWRLNIESVNFPLAQNIRVSKWFPQNDILGHNKTRLFITHGGASGVAEGVYHGVPMLCSPLMSDQFDNSNFIQNVGLGKVTNVKTTTTEKLIQDIQSIINDKGYLERARQRSRAMKLRPRSPTDEAADLIEYLNAVGSLKHLKPRGQELSFYQVYMLDVLFVIVLIVFIAVAAISTCIRKVFCRAKTKEKSKTS